MVHWAGGANGRGIVCAGDILTVATDRKWLTFMRSYPNFLPLSRREVEGIGNALKGFSFETIYGHYFDRIIAKDAVNGYLYQLAKIGVWKKDLVGMWENSPTPSVNLAGVYWK